MLENYVHPVKALRSVKDQADQLKIHNGREISYEQYSDLTIAAATNYDSQFKINTKKGSRTVYEHEVCESTDDENNSDN